MQTTAKTSRLMVLTAIIGAMTALAACNTVEGLGKDIKSGGKAIEKSAEEAKK